MKFGVILVSNYFLIVFFLVYFPDGISSCDTKWIRFVYMMSCGKRKRESVQNKTFFENLPNDFLGALEYLKENDPFHPLLLNSEFLYELMNEEEESEKPPPTGAFILDPDTESSMLVESENTTPYPFSTKLEEYTTPKEPSVLVNKLILNMNNRDRTGIPGFPDDWDIEEIMEDKINENHRREIDRLIEECCKVPPVTTCNGNTFLGACK